MTRARPTSALHNALEQYGRRARRLSVARMLEVDVIIREVGEADRLSDPAYREQLARRVVKTIETLILALPDRTDRRIAEAVLAAAPEFHDKTVTQRRQFVAEHDHGFSDDQFRTRRRRVVGDLADGISAAFRDEQIGTHKVFIAGSYRDDALDRDAAELGIALSELPVTLVSGSEMPGRRISYALADALEARGIYAPDRIMLFARTDPNKPTLADRPLGTITYFGETKAEKRREMIRISRLALLFSGRDGTLEEAHMADRAGLPVIPLAFTGGAAYEYWCHARTAIDEAVLGGKSIDVRDYEMLAHDIHSIGLQAAVRLIRQALHLSQ